MKRFNKREYLKSAKSLTVEGLLAALTREAELRYYAEAALGKIRKALRETNETKEKVEREPK